MVLSLKRKEVENYLLDAPILRSAADTSAKRRQEHVQTAHIQVPSIEEIENALSEILNDPMVRDEVKYQVIHRYRDTLPSDLDPSTKDRKANQWFEDMWSDKQWQLENCPGKEVLRRLRNWCQDKHSLALSTRNLAEQLEKCPEEINSLAQKIETHFYG